MENPIEKAGCIVFNDKNQVLLVSNTEKTNFAFPKGHVNPGEEIKTAAKREVLEETGYKVDIIHSLLAVEYLHPRTQKTIKLHLFIAKPLKLITMDQKDPMGWYSTEEASSMIRPYLKAALETSILYMQEKR